MSGVDVLNTMQRAAEMLPAKRSDSWDGDLPAARIAVADLIDAARLITRTQLCVWGAEGQYSYPIGEAQMERLRAALAQVSP